MFLKNAAKLNPFFLCCTLISYFFDEKHDFKHIYHYLCHKYNMVNGKQ